MANRIFLNTIKDLNNYVQHKSYKTTHPVDPAPQTISFREDRILCSLWHLSVIGFGGWHSHFHAKFKFCQKMWANISGGPL